MHRPHTSTRTTLDTYGRQPDTHPPQNNWCEAHEVSAEAYRTPSTTNSITQEVESTSTSVHRHSSSGQLSTSVKENSRISRRASEERRALVRAPTSTKDQYRCTQQTKDRDATDATKACHRPMPPHKMQDSRKRRGHIPLPRHVEFPALRAEAPLTWVRASPLVKIRKHAAPRQ